LRWFADEAFRMSAIGGIENGAALLDGGWCKPVVNHSRGKKAQSGMAVLFVIPGKNS
jgi:hypothetical protein